MTKGNFDLKLQTGHRTNSSVTFQFFLTNNQMFDFCNKFIHV